MKFRNLHTKIFLAFIIAVSFTVYSCKDYNSVNFKTPSGDADFSSVVAIGNSLTAGYQSGALYQSAQKYSFPALVAGQIEGVQKFEQPLISDPGIGGRIGLNNDLADPSPAQEQGSPINTNLDRPYNNLGVPGAVLADFLGQDLGPNNTYADRKQANPFFNIVLRDFGNTQAEEMAQLNPTFVMFWLGNNDVLGYVASGGNTPYVPANVFQQLYAASMQTISQTGADAVVYNIPNVTTIPYVFLVNSTLLQNGTITINQSNDYALVTPQGNVPIWVQQTDPNNPGVVQDTVMMKAPNPSIGQPGGFFLLPAQSQLSGMFANGVGLSPANPIPHALVLDNGETTRAIQLVNQYNQTIANIAGSNGFPVVDINSAFSQIFQNFQQSGGTQGITQDGITLTPVPGSLFSLDGIHPLNRGYGIVANMTIDTINNAYNANLPKINISTIPQGIPINN